MNTDLSDKRTDLAVLRSHLANERTHLAEVRTAVSLMSFGITLNRFSIYLEESNRTVRTTVFSSLHDVQNVGLGMAILGIIVLAFSLWRYAGTRKQIETHVFSPPRMSVIIFSSFLLALGAGSAIWMIRS